MIFVSFVVIKSLRALTQPALLIELLNLIASFFDLSLEVCNADYCGHRVDSDADFECYGEHGPHVRHSIQWRAWSRNGAQTEMGNLGDRLPGCVTFAAWKAIRTRE